MSSYRTKTNLRMRWLKSEPACLRDSRGGQRRPGGVNSGRRLRRNRNGRRRQGEARARMRGPWLLILLPQCPHILFFLFPFCLICRLAQEEALGLAPAATAAPTAPATRAAVPAEEEVGPRRGDFTRLEYERRAQLKLMDDLDKVLRPRASGTGGPGRGGRRATRPRSGCCDDSALARSPARGLLGEDPVGRAFLVSGRGSIVGSICSGVVWGRYSG